MATPEGKVKVKVRAVLKRYGAYYHSPVQNGMGTPSLDFVGCYSQMYFAIETKAGDKSYTPRQQTTREEIEAAGGKVFLVNEVTGTKELEEWLNEN